MNKEEKKVINDKEIFCKKHGKQEKLVNEFKCSKCFNEYWKKRYFL